MLLGKPIFPGMYTVPSHSLDPYTHTNSNTQTGTSTMNQIDRIMEIVGRPSPEDVTAIKSPFAATMLDNLPPTKPKPLSKVLENASAEALDLLRKCLHFNPQVRLAAEKSLCHPYVNKFRNTEDEPVYV